MRLRRTGRGTVCISRRELAVLLFMARKGVLVFYRDLKGGTALRLSYDQFEWTMGRLMRLGLVRRVGNGYVLSEELQAALLMNSFMA